MKQEMKKWASGRGGKFIASERFVAGRRTRRDNCLVMDDGNYGFYSLWGYSNRKVIENNFHRANG